MNATTSNEATMEALSKEAPAGLPDNLIDARQWESHWQQLRFPLTLDLRAAGPRAVTEFLRRVLPGGRRSVIEIGCGGSAWLPYFARELGYRVAGIDYSATGVYIARKNLEVLDIEARIVQGDLFDRALAVGAYDVVFSSGFIEHFPDQQAVLSRMADFLLPGGIMVTVVPNMQGLPGRLQALFNRPVYDQHLVLDAQAVESGHRAAGLETLAGPDYAGGFDLWNLNYEPLVEGRGRLFRRLFGKAMAAANLAVNGALRLCGTPNAWWASQMVMIAARKPLPSGAATQA